MVLKPAPTPVMTPESRSSSSARQPLVTSWFQ
jgi:hypothetical protein